MAPTGMSTRDLGNTQFGDPGTVEIREQRSDMKCCFCRSTEVNATELGPMYKLEDVVTHYYCLLFTSGLQQNGSDNEGILGFLLEDIKVEVKRGLRLKCKFCKKGGATIGCCKGICRHTYHFRCGYLNGCLFEFIGSYKSHCPNHKPKQQLPEGVSNECPLCFTQTGREDWILPSCCHNQLFHRSCLLQTAVTAGYFFKCPLCNCGSQKFFQEMKMNGIYIPDRDAAWELEPNAFADLVTRLHCDAAQCLCPKGREFTPRDDSPLWDIIRCELCGSVGTHLRCSSVSSLEWKCSDCKSCESKSGKGIKVEVVSRSNSDNSDENDFLPHVPCLSNIVNRQVDQPKLKVQNAQVTSITEQVHVQPASPSIPFSATPFLVQMSVDSQEKVGIRNQKPRERTRPKKRGKIGLPVRFALSASPSMTLRSSRMRNAKKATANPNDEIDAAHQRRMVAFQALVQFPIGKVLERRKPRRNTTGQQLAKASPKT